MILHTLLQKHNKRLRTKTSNLILSGNYPLPRNTKETAVSVKRLSASRCTVNALLRAKPVPKIVLAMAVPIIIITSKLYKKPKASLKVSMFIRTYRVADVKRPNAKKNIVNALKMVESALNCANVVTVKILTDAAQHSRI